MNRYPRLLSLAIKAENTTKNIFSDTDLILLAGGLGTRLRSILTEGQPKALSLVGSRPFLNHLLDYFYQQGIRHITLALGYGAESICSHVESIQLPEGMKIKYSVENTPLGTGGAIRLAVNKTQSNSIFVCNGDTITDLNLQQLYDYHNKKQATVTVALCKVDDCSRYGQVRTNRNGKVISFREKTDSPEHGVVNVGVYVVRRELLQELPEGTNLSWETDCIPNYCNRQMYGIALCNKFLDIGVPDSLRSAGKFLERLYYEK